MSKKLRIKISTRLLSKKIKKSIKNTRKICRFSADQELVKEIDYKNAKFLSSFLSETGKILAHRISGNTASYQRMVSKHIKIARTMALLPYCSISK